MEEGAIARQWHNKNDSTVENEISRQRSNSYARNNRGTVGSGFLFRSVQRLYLENRNASLRGPRVEAGSNTSTVTLQVVRGDEKGSLESETVKYDHESYGTRTRK
jgi:hypothetical protein